MSKPHYLRHDKSPNSIVVYTEELMSYLFTITNNEKQFPKAYRYTLITDIRNTCLKMNKAVYNALAIHPKFKEQADDRRKYQEKVYRKIIDIKSLLSISFKIVNITNKEHVAKLLSDMVDSYNKWVKNDNRNYRRLPTREAYIKAIEQKRENRKMKLEKTKAVFESFEHDSDGFVIFKRINK